MSYDFLKSHKPFLTPYKNGRSSRKSHFWIALDHLGCLRTFIGKLHNIKIVFFFDRV